MLAARGSAERMRQSSSNRRFCRGVHISISSTSSGEEAVVPALFRSRFLFPELTDGVGKSKISITSRSGAGAVGFAGAGAVGFAGAGDGEGGVAAGGVFFVRDLGAAGVFFDRDLGAAAAVSLVRDDAAALGVVRLTLAMVDRNPSGGLGGGEERQARDRGR